MTWSTWNTVDNQTAVVSWREQHELVSDYNYMFSVILRDDVKGVWSTMVPVLDCKTYCMCTCLMSI